MDEFKDGVAALGYKMKQQEKPVFKGNEQWRVRWEGEGEEGDTWETFRVLDTEALRRRAEELRAEAS